MPHECAGLWGELPREVYPGCPYHTCVSHPEAPPILSFHKASYLSKILGVTPIFLSAGSVPMLLQNPTLFPCAGDLVA